MNELLEKYFRGETSLAEERELKRYFISGNVAAEHEIYRALFEEFKLESNETANVPLKKVIPEQRKIKRIWFQTFAYTAIAATLLLLVWIQFPQANDDFAVIDGKKIENPEYVQRYTEKKLSKVNNILARSMEPMKSFNKVRQDMEPLQNVRDVRNKMNAIQSKLKIK
jgi:hypothetical protein